MTNAFEQYIDVGIMRVLFDSLIHIVLSLAANSLLACSIDCLLICLLAFSPEIDLRVWLCLPAASIFAHDVPAPAIRSFCPTFGAL